MNDIEKTPPRETNPENPDVRGSNPRLPTFEKEPPPPPEDED